MSHMVGGVEDLRAYLPSRLLCICLLTPSGGISDLSTSISPEFRVLTLGAKNTSHQTGDRIQ